jgi:hypothetical protein
VAVEGDDLPFYRPEARGEAAGRPVVGPGSSQELSNGEGEGGTAWCRAAGVVASRDSGVDAACAPRRPGRRRRGERWGWSEGRHGSAGQWRRCGRVRGNGGGAEATVPLTTRVMRRRGCSGVVKVGDAAKSSTTWCWASVRCRILRASLLLESSEAAMARGPWRANFAGDVLLLLLGALPCVVHAEGHRKLCGLFVYRNIGCLARRWQRFYSKLVHASAHNEKD